MTSPGVQPYVWMLCGSVSFTVMAELAFGLTRETDWPLVASVRAGFAAVFAALLAYGAGARLVFWRPARLWIRSLAGSCSMVCTFYAFAKLPTVDVLTLTNTFPLWVTLLGWPLYGQVPSRGVWLAVASGVLGVALIEQPHLESGNTGALAALAAAIFTAVAMLGLHALSEVQPLAIVVHFSLVATAFCVAAACLLPRRFGPLHLEQPDLLIRLFFLGLSATIGQVFLTRAFGSGAPAKVSVVGLSQIVMVFAYDVAFRGHEVNALAILGTALVVTPTAWILIHEPRRVPPASVDIRATQSNPKAESNNEATSVMGNGLAGARPCPTISGRSCGSDAARP